MAEEETQNERMQSLFYIKHTDSKQKLHYFLLASAGASIGYAITATGDFTLGWPGFFLIMSVLAWSGSFYSGVQALRCENYLYKTQLDLLAECKKNPLSQDEADRTLQEKVGPIISLHDKWQKRQITLLLTGAGLMFSWKIFISNADLNPQNLLQKICPII